MGNEYKTPTLFATNSRGDLKTWQATCQSLSDQYVIITYTFGLDKGKKQTQEKTIATGKNIGRSNETTPFEQAVKEVRSKMKKKTDKGYSSSKDNLVTPRLPMLALPFQKRKHNVIYPAYAQPKIDGVRMLTRMKYVDKVEMSTRKGKEFTIMDHLEKELTYLFHRLARTGDRNFYLDGELYSDTLTFQELAGAVRRTENSEKILKQIKYIVFDCFHIERPDWLCQDRVAELTRIRFNDLDYITCIRTFEVKNEQAVYEFNRQFCIPNNYEGAIVRNKRGLYSLNHRSKDLQKLKMFQDAEYQIVGFKEGEGNEVGCVIWNCKTETDSSNPSQSFWVRPRGSHTERKELFNTGKDMVGKMLTVRFQELTDDGIPRFPVGIAIRDYEGVQQ